MNKGASQITSVSIVCSTVPSDTYQRKHQRSASLAFVRAIHRWPVNSPHQRPVTRKMHPFDDVIMEWWNVPYTVPVIGMESIVTRTRLHYIRYNLVPGICSRYKPAAMEKHMSFPAKIQAATLLYSALSIYGGHFSVYNSGKHPIARALGQGMGCRSWVQIRPNFFHCNVCAVSNIYHI